MGFHAAIYLFIASGLTGLGSEDVHTSFTELPADALYTFGGKRVGFTDEGGALPSISFITCQQYIGCTDVGGFSLAFTDHRFQLLTFLPGKINMISDHLIIPPELKATDILAFMQH